MRKSKVTKILNAAEKDVAEITPEKFEALLIKLLNADREDQQERIAEANEAYYRHCRMK